MLVDPALLTYVINCGSCYCTHPLYNDWGVRRCFMLELRDFLRLNTPILGRHVSIIIFWRASGKLLTCNDATLEHLLVRTLLARVVRPDFLASAAVACYLPQTSVQTTHVSQSEAQN